MHSALLGAARLPGDFAGEDAGAGSLGVAAAVAALADAPVDGKAGMEAAGLLSDGEAGS